MHKPLLEINVQLHLQTARMKRQDGLSCLEPPVRRASKNQLRCVARYKLH